MRTVHLDTVERGRQTFVLIFRYNGTFEPAWRPLAGSWLLDHLPVVSSEDLNHALAGWTRPLVHAIRGTGSSIEMTRRLPVVAQQCRDRDTCMLHIPARCAVRSKHMPTCYVMDGVSTDADALAYRVVTFWKEGAFVVVVEYPEEIDHA